MENTKIVAVCGGSGSGKSTIVRYLWEKIGSQRAVILTMDHYYKDLSHLSAADREKVNFDSPDALDLDKLAEHILMLKEGQKIPRPTYCFKTHARLPNIEMFSPKPIIFLDGILSLHHPEIRRICDYGLFVDVAADLRFIRRLRRDTMERGRSVDGVINQYLETVRPMYEQFVNPQRDHASVVIDWTDYNYAAVDEIIADFGLIRG